jgi:hypothetical protein
VGVQEVEDTVGDGPDGLHEIRRQRSALTLVNVHEPEARLEAELVRGDGGFDLEDCVAVIENRVHRRSRFAGAFAVHP